MPQTQAQVPALPFELASLADARRYQEWVLGHVGPHLGNRILEIGSGIGTMSKLLPLRERLMLSEFDPALYSRLERDILLRHPKDERVSCHNLGVGPELFDDARGAAIDTVVSFNVMEHVAHDEEAFASSFDLLRTAVAPAHLVTFVPAHQWAYGEIDRTFGHFRRYGHQSLLRMWKRLAPDFEVQYRYLNLPGLLAWFGLGRVLGRSSFGTGTVKNFEHLLPILRPIDDFLHGPLRLPFGQSLLMVATAR